MPRCAFAAALATTIAVMAGQAAAQPVRVFAGEPPAPPGTQLPMDWRGTLSFAVENDKFGGNTDRNYSSGLQLTWRSPTAELPRPLAWLDRQLDGLMGPGDLRWGLAIGQNIYTPRDTRARNPDPTDRPYSASLYAAVSLSRATSSTLTVLELQGGVVGPAAFGEQVQNGFHRAAGINRTYGWNRQLSNEPVFNLVAERKWRLPLANIAGLEVEALPSVTLSLGNGNTYGAVGGMLRFGQGLAADFGPARIRPALAGSAFFQPEANPNGREWGWYIFTGLEARGVARDIALDGNTFRNSRRVDSRPFVADVQAGAAIFWRNYRLSYTQILRSEEFYGQPGGMQQFGSINLALRF